MIPGMGALAAEKRAYQAERAVGTLNPTQPTIREKVMQAQQVAEDDLKRLARINELLDKNPEFEELMTLLQQGFRY